MKRILCLLVAALFAGGGAASADTFRFAYTKGEKYRIVSQIRESVYVNGSYSHDSDILDKIAVTVTDTKGDAGLHDVTYEDSERVVGSDAPYDWSEEYTSTFWRDARGAYTIDPSLFMPMVRDVPLFPDGEIKQGDTWLARGSEVDDFRANFGIPQPFQFPIDVEYTYTGRETRDGVDCAVFSINYEIFHPVTAAATGKMYPTRVAGYSHQKFWWDIAGRRPLYDEESFDFLYSFNTGDQVEYKGDSKGTLIPSAPLDKVQVAGDIQKQIDAQKIPGVSVAPSATGVTITMENVNFPPDSDTLLPPEQDKLRRIGQILAQYPDRDIAVSGFTARAAGYTEEDYQTLSTQRAKAAANFLLSIGARKASQMTVRGMGASSPIGDNSNEEGRKKNRRVEITILEN